MGIGYSKRDEYLRNILSSYVVRDIRSILLLRVVFQSLGCLCLPTGLFKDSMALRKCLGISREVVHMKPVGIS
jgi:hypothetical protein